MKIKKPGAVVIEGHVQGLSNVRSLGEKGIPVIVIDKTNCIARYSKYCKGFFKCPDFNSDEFTPFLIDLCKKENLQDWVLIPSNDHAVKNISQNKTELEKYYKIITDDYSIISKIYNKKELLNLAEGVNVPIPKTYYPADSSLVDFYLSFPVIVKGIEGLTFYKTLGKKVFVTENKEELIGALKKIEMKIPLNNVFIQEIIRREENSYVCSFTSFSVNGEIKSFWIGEKVREHPSEFGTATFTRSIPVNETLELSKKLLSELNYTGVCEIEFIKDSFDDTYKLIEINARTWLWVGLAKECGIDYAWYIYAYLNNIEINYPKDYKTNFAWSNFWVDIIFTTKDIIIDGKDFKELSTIFENNTIQSVISKKDFKPFLMMTLLLPYIFIKRI